MKTEQRQLNLEIRSSFFTFFRTKRVLEVEDRLLRRQIKERIDFASGGEVRKQLEETELRERILIQYLNFFYGLMKLNIGVGISNRTKSQMKWEEVKSRTAGWGINPGEEQIPILYLRKLQELQIGENQVCFIMEGRSHI